MLLGKAAQNHSSCTHGCVVCGSFYVKKEEVTRMTCCEVSLEHPACGTLDSISVGIWQRQRESCLLCAPVDLVISDGERGGESVRGWPWLSSFWNSRLYLSRFSLCGVSLSPHKTVGDLSTHISRNGSYPNDTHIHQHFKPTGQKQRFFLCVTFQKARNSYGTPLM